eukprot:jgi/Astpho2/4633/fgenesh1_pg.00067_%23_145_t
MAVAAVAEGDSLQAEAFQRLYPAEFLSKFVTEGVRPDGRPLGRARQISIGLGVISTANSSALIKIGSTTLMAGIKLEVAVEMTALASAAHRPGRVSPAAQSLTERVSSILQAAGAVDLKDLCISPGKAVWCVYLELYILDAAGSLLDAALLAAVAALSTLKLPQAVVNNSGNVTLREAEQQQESPKQTPAVPLRLRAVPLCTTCILYEGQLLTDPTAEEEALAACTISTAMDERDRLIAGPFLLGQREVQCTVHHAEAASHKQQIVFAFKPPQDPTFDQAKQVMGWALVAYFLCWTLSPFFQPKVRRRHHTVVLLSRFLKVLVVCEIARVMSFAVVHLLQPACAQPASQLPPSDAPAHSSWWNAYGLTDAAAKRIPKDTNSCGLLTNMSGVTPLLVCVYLHSIMGQDRAMKMVLWFDALGYSLLTTLADSRDLLDVLVAWYTVPLVVLMARRSWTTAPRICDSLLPEQAAEGEQKKPLLQLNGECPQGAVLTPWQQQNLCISESLQRQHPHPLPGSMPPQWCCVVVAADEVCNTAFPRT